jgi:transketolase
MAQTLSAGRSGSRIALSLQERANLEGIARSVRERILRYASVKRVHIGAALSVTDILVTLYFRVLRVDPAQPEWPGRDRLIFSKGHAALALYATLEEAGYFPSDLSATFGQPGNCLAGHPVQGIPGVDMATGALGHGLSVGAGLALAARMDGVANRTVVILGDGELDEGSIWEAAMFVGHHALHQLIAIVDRNGLQQEGPTARILDLEPLADKWQSFGWKPVVIDGHDVRELAEALDFAFSASGRPVVLIAKTVKGKGVSFMENDPAWHMGWLQGDLLARALTEVGATRQP